MLQRVIRTICDRPGDTQAEREARSLHVARSVLGFRPRDSMEFMLAGMVVIHAHLIEDSANDAFQGEAEARRTKSTVVALDRMMLGFLREFRIAQKRPLEGGDDTGPPGDGSGPVKPETEIANPPAEAVEPPAEASSNAQPETAKALPETPKPQAAGDRPKPSSAPPASPRSALPEAVFRPLVPFLPPCRDIDSSIAAMMAVLSTPSSSHPVPSTPGKRAASHRSLRSHGRSRRHRAGRGPAAVDPPQRDAPHQPAALLPSRANSAP
jgi:hypothetical protein